MAARGGRLEGVLLDIDGVLTVSWRPIAGAPEALARLRDAGLPFRLVTNTTTRSRASLAETLRGAGFAVGPDDLVTAPVATAAYLRSHHPGARVFLLAKGDVARDLEGVELVEEGADVVVIAGTEALAPGETEDVFTYENLNRAFGMLAEGAALVAMHRNLYWREEDGLVLDSGVFTLGLERAAGVEAAVVGKPSADFFREAVRLLGAAPERVAMVGDDLENDVHAAQAVGLTGVLVLSGKTRVGDLERARARPDHVLESVAELPGLLGL